jgi:uncharacterized protein (AIM24 family)
MQLEVVPGLVPSVLATMDPGESIYGEHGIMLYKDTPVAVGRKTVHTGGLLQGMERVSVGGMPFFLTEFTGPGHVAFSRDGVGEVRVVELAQNEVLDVREGSILCASASVGYGMFHVHGTHRPGRMIGFWMDRLTGPGSVALHGYGNVLSMALQPRESVTLDAGALLYKSGSAEVKTMNLPFGGGLLGHLESLEVLEVTGPGKLAFQSVDPGLPHD